MTFEDRKELNTADIAIKLTMAKVRRVCKRQEFSHNNIGERILVEIEKELDKSWDKSSTSQDIRKQILSPIG